MLALRVSISLTLGIMAGGMGLRQALILEGGDLLCIETKINRFGIERPRPAETFVKPPVIVFFVGVISWIVHYVSEKIDPRASHEITRTRRAKNTTESTLALLTSLYPVNALQALV